MLVWWQVEGDVSVVDVEADEEEAAPLLQEASYDLVIRYEEERRSSPSANVQQGLRRD